MSILSRKWGGHLWIKDHVNFEIEHVDVGVTAYHTPNQTLRVYGRFSNGLQTKGTTFALTVFAEVASEDVYILQMYERVPMTKLGGTQVKYKDESMMLPGDITRLRASAGVISNSPSVSVKVTYKIEDEELYPKDFKFKDKPSGIKFETGRDLDELPKANVCEMANTWNDEDSEWFFGVRCDPQSGETYKYREIKKHPTPPPGKNQLY